MKQLSESKYVEKKSKFFGFLFEIEEESEVESIIRNLRKEHKKSNHICYAYTLESEEVFKNDGEVGYPGKTLLSLLKEKSFKTHLLIVVRYFGGVKLGPGGVSRAFKQAGMMTL